MDNLSFSRDVIRRKTICYEFFKKDLDTWTLIVERGVCDEFRVWWKWKDKELEYEIFLGVDADGRFNVCFDVRVRKELWHSYHYTDIWT